MKNRLSSADYQQVLSCIEGIHRCRRLEDFPHHVLAESRKLIDCSLAGYNEVNLLRRRIVAVLDSPQPEIDENAFDRFGKLMHEHPVISYFDRTGDGQALKISDFLSAREFHRRAIYREFYRHLGAEDQISVGVRVSADFMIGVAFNRPSRSFTEKDRLRLNLVRPHIIEAYRHLAELAGHRERESDFQAALRESGGGCIAADGTGKILHATPGALDCLSRHLAVPAGPHPALPPRIAQWLRGAGPAAPLAPLTLQGDEGRLIVRHARSEGGRQLLLLSEEGVRPAPWLDRFSLTAREREVLRWLGESKSNGEIAVILGLHPGTVKNYVERILAKLGVENRTAAALLARDAGLSQGR